MQFTFLIASLVALPGDPGETSPSRLRLRTLAADEIQTALGSPGVRPALKDLRALAESAIERLDGEGSELALRGLVEDSRWNAVLDPNMARGELAKALWNFSEELTFEPLIEADLPRGFPEPTPVHGIELKELPTYRLARAESRPGKSDASFWKLFLHIQRNDIPMTAPVEMTFQDSSSGPKEAAMAFLYGSTDIGEPGADGSLEVLDTEPTWVVSLGGIGRPNERALERGRGRIEAWLAGRPDLRIDGPWRLMGYNSPMVPERSQFYEVQVPVAQLEPEGVSKREEDVRERADVATPMFPAVDEGAVLFDFSDSQVVRGWRSVDDSVMGGISDSTMSTTERGTAIFAGRVSLENNGGFASVRASMEPMDLERSDRLAIRYRGDGQRYKLRLRMDRAFDGISYELAFDTEEGVWCERHLDLADFQPTWRGRRPRGAEELDPSRVRGVGLMISDKQEGTFELEVASIFRVR